MREDLEMRKAMEAAGFTAAFHSMDVLFKRQECPNHDLTFTRGDMHVWRAGFSHSTGVDIYWRAAFLVGGKYQGHQTYNRLQDVLDGKPRPDKKHSGVGGK